MHIRGCTDFQKHSLLSPPPNSLSWGQRFPATLPPLEGIILVKIRPNRPRDHGSRSPTGSRICCLTPEGQSAMPTPTKLGTLFNFDFMKFSLKHTACTARTSRSNTWGWGLDSPARMRVTQLPSFGPIDQGTRPSLGFRPSA